MEKSLFRFIWRFSSRQQMVILLITIVSYPVTYILLELPKLIVNDAIQGENFPRAFYGMEFDQVSYLVLLCFTFLGLVVLSNGIKLILNVYKGRLGERMLRRLRFELFQRVLRFRLPHFKKVSSGEIIPMITSEVEDVGGFIGEAIALPAYQGGMLAVQIGFIFMQDPLLGLAAISSYPMQAYVIPKLQRRVVLLSRQRVRNVRLIADKVGESIGGISEIHANDASAWHSADLADRLYANYLIRFKIFNWKYFIKFLNNFMNQLTPFLFYLIGGWLVIEGNLSIGALLAVIAAYKDLAGPWKELLSYYQMVADVDVKYQTVVENFDPIDIYPVSRLTADEDTTLEGPLVMKSVTFSGGAAGQEVFDVSFKVDEGTHVAVIGPDGSGRSEVLQLAAGLIGATSGRVEIGGHNLDHLPESVLGRQIAYVGSSVHVWTGTLRDNVVYGLRHRPLRAPDREGSEKADHERRLAEARATANPEYDVEASWEDLERVGCEDIEGLDARALDLIEMVGLAPDVYRMGLQSPIDPTERPNVAERILSVRKALADKVAHDERLSAMIELWQVEAFNNSASIAENLLFAAPADQSEGLASLAADAEVVAVLRKTGLYQKLVNIGARIAETMVELFSNVSGDSGLLGDYSFITQEELPEFERITRITRLESGRTGLATADEIRLIGLAFKLVPARHRLGLLDDALKEEIVAARDAFHKRFASVDGRFVEFDRDSYIAPMSIEDNLLFGRPRVDRRDARERIDKVIRALVEEADLRGPIIRAGLDFHVGVAGSRLSTGQRRRVALVRALMKNARITILDETAVSLNDDDKALRATIRGELAGRTLLFGATNLPVAEEFDHSVIMQQGRVKNDAET
ncbi:MAG: ABC transporter ATP-binding protein [Stappia sp.]|uniref:ATP-binding cassette domain-containing protein n=1 Tax=Stappia sp. TaxID=1870903 RepID=UPI000C3DD10A|nr:ATP-binding cassette domain-containing protein [Stappia sp.]MAA98643.1 ABC transporter ATP-binding protein [Stappia sp.]MBM20528.1 ABC transporter ATP-binding protein [Stappia sp.]